MTPDEFLADEDGHFSWQVPANAPSGVGLVPVAAFAGRGTHPLEVAVATATRRPRADEVRRVWAGRHGHAPNPLLLVASYEENGSWKASICGPVGDEPPVEAGLELSEVERIAAAALAEPSRHAAIRLLSSIWAELETDLPGLRNQGMFATHELRDGVPLRADWDEAGAKGQTLLPYRGRDLVEKLGFAVETHATAASVLSIAGTKRAIAVFLDEGEEFEATADRFGGASPVSHALALADRENLPWVIATRGRQIRVHSTRPDVGVGRKGRSETYVEANLALLPDDRAGYVPLLFSADALQEGGSFDAILEGSRDYSADLGARLRERVYNEAVPSLAIALARRHAGALGEDALEHIYERALTVFFRLLFVAYAEDKDLLPYRSNGAYREHALKTLARELAGRRAEGPLVFDKNSTDLWDDVAALWLAVDKGNVERGVPAYNGGLFSSDASVNAAGATLAGVRLTNAEFGPALAAMLVDEAEDGVVGPVDFRSLSVREFGTIYEGLLESSLSIAPSDLALDDRRSYVPAHPADEVVVRGGEVYFHDQSGARKATGSYFTKPFAVEHLLDHALEPALEEHLARVKSLLDGGEEAKAARAFFDFRCVDLAMGSGHFLVAAIDRIEARLSAFLALHPIPKLNGELDRLRKAALKALGPLGEGVEIEQASLLRRQVARRCIYGVDLNPIAVELARLAIWIHTFVPGLPLSFLDHSLRHGDSLTGIGTLDEAIQALDPEHAPGQPSLFRDQILAVLGRAETSLQRLANISEASKAEIDKAREAQHHAEQAVAPAADLFDLVVAARLAEASPLHAFEEEEVAANPDLPDAKGLCEALNALHFAIAFPEVFLSDRPGFDCVLGNPPWDEIHENEDKFWTRYFPGYRSLSGRERGLQREIYERERPDLARQLQLRRDALQKAKVAINASVPREAGKVRDYFQAFVWRALALLAEGGRLGYVLPRNAVAEAAGEKLRDALFGKGVVESVVWLANRRHWVFDDVETRQRLILIAWRKGGATELFDLHGTFYSLEHFRSAAEPISLHMHEIVEWSPKRAVPCPPVAGKGLRDVLDRFVQHPRLSAHDPTILSGMHGKASEFRRWTEETEDGELTGDLHAVQARNIGIVVPRLDAPTIAESVLNESPEQTKRSVLAFAQVTQQDNERALRLCVLPPRCLVKETAYYLDIGEDGERMGFYLGILGSILFDWYARFWIGYRALPSMILGLSAPVWDSRNPDHRALSHAAVQLAAKGEEFDSEVDARVAHIVGLSDVSSLLATYHWGKDLTDLASAIRARIQT